MLEGRRGPLHPARRRDSRGRDGELHAYGVDSPLTGYSYYGDRLLDWIVDRLSNQHGSPDDPLEPVGRYLDACGRPSEILVAIGATRYTALGESTYLEPGDESIVVVYDSTELAPEDVPQALGREGAGLAAASVLIQRVRPGQPDVVTGPTTNTSWGVTGRVQSP